MRKRGTGDGCGYRLRMLFGHARVKGGVTSIIPFKLADDVPRLCISRCLQLAGPTQSYAQIIYLSSIGPRSGSDSASSAQMVSARR